MSSFTVCIVSVSVLSVCSLVSCGFGWVGMVAAVAGGWCLASLRVRVSLCHCVCLLCGAVSCRVSRVVARYFFFAVPHQSLVVDCLSLCCALSLCVAVCGCVVLGERGGRRGMGCMHRTPLHVGVVPVHTGDVLNVHVFFF